MDGDVPPSTSPLRLLAVPIADRNTASSRLRLHDLVTHLPDRFQPTIVRPRDDADLRRHDPSGFDVVYIQKEARPEVVDFVRRAADAGVPIVYDIDDDFGTWPRMEEETMCRLATTVTVDSQGRADELRALTQSDPVVLPCMIDLAGDPSRQYHRLPQGGVNTVASFGNLVSLRNTLPFMTAVPKHIDTYVIGPADAGEELPGSRLVPFGVDTFVADLLAADVFVLAHGEHEAPLKDNNRLIMAMSLGVPSIVSPTRSYLDVLKPLGLEWLACGPDEVVDRLARLADPSVRADVGRIGRDHAWAHYRPQQCARNLIGVLDAVAVEVR